MHFIRPLLACRPLLRPLLARGRPLSVASAASASAIAIGSAVSQTPAACASASSGSGGGGVTDMLSGFPGVADVSALQMQMLGVSGVSGYTAGFAIKRAFKVLVFTTGCIFMGLQTLAQNGLITVHFDEIEKRMQSVADPAALQSSQDQLQAYLAAGLPSATTFSAGFVMGLRS